VVALASLVTPMVLEAKVEGFLVAMAAPFLLGLVLTGLFPRVGAVILGVVSAATLAFSGPYIAQALSHPESATDFVPQTFFTLALLVGAAAAIPAFREHGRREGSSRTPHIIVLVAGIAAVAASTLSIAAATRVDSVAAQPGDTTVLTRNFAFVPASVSAKAGIISVHLVNEDRTRHTFTIDGLTDLSVPPNSNQRITFEAKPGTYRFFCRPHDADMDGVLVVK
jgi:plastocyanin